jgi:hypothetical protein
MYALSSASDAGAHHAASSLKVALRSALLYDCTELMPGSVTDLQYCENIFAMSELSHTGDEVILYFP